MFGKRHIALQKQMCRFLCYLLNNTAKAIIKATFMIATTINPQNNRLMIDNNIDSTIDTTSLSQIYI